MCCTTAFSAQHAQSVLAQDVPMCIQFISQALQSLHCPAHQQRLPLTVVLPMAPGVTGPRHTTGLIGVLLCRRAQKA